MRRMLIAASLVFALLIGVSGVADAAKPLRTVGVDATVTAVTVSGGSDYYRLEAQVSWENFGARAYTIAWFGDGECISFHWVELDQRTPNAQNIQAPTVLKLESYEEYTVKVELMRKTKAIRGAIAETTIPGPSPQ